MTIDRVIKFTRKASEYKLIYTLLVHTTNEDDTTAGKYGIEQTTKLFKYNHSAMNTDYEFINNLLSYIISVLS